MSILNFIQHQKAVNEASLLSTYYSNADKNTKNIAKKVDDLLKAVVTDKKKLEELTDLITDLNDAYAEERIDSQKMEERAVTEKKLDDESQDEFWDLISDKKLKPGLEPVLTALKDAGFSSEDVTGFIENHWDRL
jgi:septal ring factor EnvC (AmiA/AmiB activator)